MSLTEERFDWGHSLRIPWVRAFCDNVKTTPGVGRCSHIPWSGLCIATVIKRTEQMRVVDVTRELTRGVSRRAQRLLLATAGCTQFKTALMERFNGPMRLTRWKRSNEGCP